MIKFPHASSSPSLLQLNLVELVTRFSDLIFHTLLAVLSFAKTLRLGSCDTIAIVGASSDTVNRGFLLDIDSYALVSIQFVESPAPANTGQFLILSARRPLAPSSDCTTNLSTVIRSQYRYYLRDER
jgi:hypothetical protein